MIRPDQRSIRASLLPMPARRRILAGLGLVAATTFLLRVALEIHAQAPRRELIARIGQQFPHFAVANRDGQINDLSTEGAGRRRVIIFFSPACRICREELPYLEPFPAGLRLVMVDVEGDGSLDALETPAGAEAARYYDRGNVFRRSFPMLGVPLILFVDEQNILRDGLAGGSGRESLQHKLRLFAGKSEEAGQ